MVNNIQAIADDDFAPAGDNPAAMLETMPSPEEFDPLAPQIKENPLLKGIDPEKIRQAWFTMAHLILEDGMQVLDIRCQDGENSFIMAAMNPSIEFLGIDRDVNMIERAEKKYDLPNLKFIAGDIQENFVPPRSIDAIVNSFTMHEIYSDFNANEKAVVNTIERQFELLKTGGTLFIQDHVLPTEHDYLLIEIPEEIRTDSIPDKPIEQFSDVELLLLFAEQARPREEAKYRGFYLEELPARFPRTRLFRMPAKWAQEFILRKDNRAEWESELYKEYSFFTLHDFTKAIQGAGARMFYNGPHWDQHIIRHRINNKIRIFDDHGTPLGAPETSTVIVAQKQDPKTSLTLEERKPARNAKQNIRITAMRNSYEGTIYDIVSRDMKVSEVIPYYVSDDNKLHVFLHEGLPRSLVNTVPRQAVNLDRKQWSGHMTEALAIPEEKIEEIKSGSFRDLLVFSREFFGLKPYMNTPLEDGPGFYPAPDCIDERIKTKYICVNPRTNTRAPHYIIAEADGFSTKGRVRDYDAQQILNAVGVGLLPSSRLELQILALYERLGVSYQSWASSPLTLGMAEPDKISKVEEYVARMATEDNRYEPTKGTAGTIKTMHSVFVDEGQEDGSIKGLASRDMDFFLNGDHAMNMAVVLPLSRKSSGEVMAGVVENYLPIPQRYKGTGYTVSCPSMPLPPEITNFDMAYKYIAEKFEVPVECVSRMGEGFFSHIGVTPQRIYPFVVTPKGPSGWRKVGRTHGVTSHAPLYRLYRLLYLDNYDSFMKIVAMSYQSCLGQNSTLSASLSFGENHAERRASFEHMDVPTGGDSPMSKSTIDLDNE